MGDGVYTLKATEKRKGRYRLVWFMKTGWGYCGRLTTQKFKYSRKNLPFYRGEKIFVTKKVILAREIKTYVLLTPLFETVGPLSHFFKIYPISYKFILFCCIHEKIRVSRWKKPKFPAFVTKLSKIPATKLRLSEYCWFKISLGVMIKGSGIAGINFYSFFERQWQWLIIFRAVDSPPLRWVAPKLTNYSLNGTLTLRGDCPQFGPQGVFWIM